MIHEQPHSDCLGTEYRFLISYVSVRTVKGKPTVLHFYVLPPCDSSTDWNMRITTLLLCWSHSLLYFQLSPLSSDSSRTLNDRLPSPPRQMQFLWRQRLWLVVHYCMSNGLIGRHDERQQEDTYIKRPSSLGRDKIMKNKVSDPFTWYFYFLGLVLSLWHTLTHLRLKTTQ